MRFNRFPITRKFHFSSGAHILFYFVEPKNEKILETTKMLYDINRIKADDNAIYILCITKNDFNYSKEDTYDIIKFGKENNLEIIFSSAFSQKYGLEDDVLEELINKYNNKIKK